MLLTARARMGVARGFVKTIGLDRPDENDTRCCCASSRGREIEVFKRETESLVRALQEATSGTSSQAARQRTGGRYGHAPSARNDRRRLRLRAWVGSRCSEDVA